MKRSKLGLILAVIFLGLFGLAVLYLNFFLSKTGELSGVILVLFAVPWIYFIGKVSNINLAIGLSVAMNAFIIYFLGNFLGNIFRGVGREASLVVQTSQDRVVKLWKNFNIFFWIFFILSFSTFLQMLNPNSLLAVTSSQLSYFAKIGIIITLAYFGYSITTKKMFLLLGLFGVIPLFFPLIGYCVLWWLKNNTVKKQASA